MSEKIVILKGNEKHAEFPLSGDRVILGSDADCAIHLTDDGVLSRHAILEKENGAWRLLSVDPSRPIECGGRLANDMILTHGILFSLGQARLRFVTSKAILEAHPLSGTPVIDQAAAMERLKQTKDLILKEIARVIVGQKDVLNQILVTFFSRGHCLIIGVPGLAKTLIVRALAGTLDLDCKRIQFTPDLMPADITGTNILEEDNVTGKRQFRFSQGPLFTNFLLADEINRTPPKTQAALLEAMQERQVTVSGAPYDLPEPFMVLATQNPIEQEGTYPLPEAQLDRFMLCIHIHYPDAKDEQNVLLETTRDRVLEVNRVLDADTILEFQHFVRQMPVSEHVALYATNLIRATRPDTDEALDFISRWVRWGAGTRAGQYLLLAAKAHVLLNGRSNVSCADIRKYALPVLRHRIFCNFTASSEGVSVDEIVQRVLNIVKEPQYDK